MNGKFLAYGLLVTMLSTGVSWTRFINSISNSQTSGRSTGSSWTSTSGTGSTSSGSHK